MAERANVFELTQFGVEGTPGSPATANRRMTGMMVSPGVAVDISQYRPSGYLFPTVAALNREWVEADISGPITYSELIYPLNSVLKADTPSGSPAYTWTFDPASDAAETIKTYTVEYGSSARAARFAYGIFTGLTLRFSRESNEMTATMLGQAISDGITMVGTPTTVSLVPVTPPQVTVKLADTQAGLAGASALARPIEVEWSITNRYGPVWVLNGSTSFPAHVELVPELSVRLLLAADAEGMGLLTTMRNNAFKFMRIQATGSSIGTVAPYSMQIDTAFKVTDVSEWRDEDGLTAIEWTGQGFHDSTWDATTRVDIVNEIASL
jgi:hypothetical protein